MATPRLSQHRVDAFKTPKVCIRRSQPPTQGLRHQGPALGRQALRFLHSQHNGCRVWKIVAGPRPSMSTRPANGQGHAGLDLERRRRGRCGLLDRARRG